MTKKLISAATIIASASAIGIYSLANAGEVKILGFNFQAPWVSDADADVDYPVQGDIIFERTSSAAGVFKGYTGSGDQWVNLSPSTGAYALVNVRRYDGTTCTSGSGSNECTWTKGDIDAIYVEVYGGGGGGGGADKDSGSGGSVGSGGGGGGFCAKFVTSGSLDSTETVKIGAGGTAGAASGGGSGGTGGTSEFGASGEHCLAEGGAGGVGDNTPETGTTIVSTGGLGGLGSNGLVNSRGQHGFQAVMYGAAGYAQGGLGGRGGGPMGGSGARQPSIISASGGAGQFPAGGGSGAIATDVTENAGGAGAGGMVIVYEYEVR